MKDHNSIKKYNCTSCSNEINFIWSSSIFNNNKFARLCNDCRQNIFNDILSNTSNNSE